MRVGTKEVKTVPMYECADGSRVKTLPEMRKADAAFHLREVCRDFALDYNAVVAANHRLRETLRLAYRWGVRPDKAAPARG